MCCDKIQTCCMVYTCQLLLCDDFGVSYMVGEESKAIGVFEA